MRHNIQLHTGSGLMFPPRIRQVFERVRSRLLNHCFNAANRIVRSEIAESSMASIVVGR